MANEPDMVKILFLGANPTNSRLALDEEVRAIDERLQAASMRDRFELAQGWATRTSDLQGYLLRHRPGVVHFSGHGSEAGALIMTNRRGEAAEVPPDALADLFRQFSGTIRCVVLNACYSEGQAEAIARSIDFVIGMKTSVLDEAAIIFSESFYRALGHGEAIESAFELACNAIALEGIPQADVPKLKTRSGAKAVAAATPGPITKVPTPGESLALIVLNDARYVLAPHSRAEVHDETIDLELRPQTPRAVGTLREMKNGRREPIGIAFGDHGYLATAVTLTEALEGGRTVVRMKLNLEKREYGGGLMEMSFNTLSADQIAELRARRLLLNEKRESKDFMLDLFVSGRGTAFEVKESPFPALFGEFADDAPQFMAAARLFGVLLLRLSGIVEHIFSLDLKLAGKNLIVNFEGQRARRYGNVDPAVIAVNGVCRLQ